MIKKYFLGEYSLAKTFWIGQILIANLILPFLLAFILSNLGFSLNSSKLILYPIPFIFAIGVWNSSKIYSGKKIWKILALGFIVIQLSIYIYRGFTIISNF